MITPIARRILLGALAALALGGCTGVPIYAPGVSDLAEESFVPATGRALVYLARVDPHGYPGIMLAGLDGGLQAELPPHTYLRFEPAPGTRTVSVSTVEGEVGLALDVLAGRSYFIEVDARWGNANPVPRMALVDGVQGRRTVLARRRGEFLAYAP